MRGSGRRLRKNQACEEVEGGGMEKVNMGCQRFAQVGAGQKWQRIHYLRGVKCYRAQLGLDYLH